MPKKAMSKTAKTGRKVGKKATKARKTAKATKGIDVLTQNGRGRRANRNTDYTQFAARVGANVLYLRKLRYGTSDVRQLSQMVGISYETWYAVERGDNPVRAGSNIDRIAKFFKVDVGLFSLPPEEFRRKVTK